MDTLSEAVAGCGMDSEEWKGFGHRDERRGPSSWHEPEGTGIQGWMQCGRTVRDLPEWDRGGQTEAEPGRSDSGSESREDEES